jgi:hypothetical protein
MPAMRCLSLLPEDRMDYHSVVNLIRNCPGLRTFTYRYVGDYDVEDEDNFLPALARHCPKLQTLRYDSYSKYESDFTQLVQSCPDLHTVDFLHTGDTSIHAIVLTHCTKLRALRTAYLQEETVPLLLTRLSQLEHLSLGNLQCTAASLLELAEHCGNLTSLAVDPYEEYPSRSVDMTRTMDLFLSKLVRVEMLDLARARWLTDDLLLTIATHCKRLRCFAVDIAKRKISASAISALIEGCPLLTEISHCYFDKVLSVEANRAMWRRQRPCLLVDGSYPLTQYWDRLVYGGTCVL